MKKKRPKRAKEPPRIGAIAIARTADRKTGPISVTWVAQITCPVTCVLREEGCNMEAGPGGLTTRRLNYQASYWKMSFLELAEQEAYAICCLPLGNDIRPHLVGDCRTDETAMIVAAAAEDYIRRTNDLLSWPGWRIRERDRKRAYGYSHAWRTVQRSSWGSVSILASCETWVDVDTAWSRGYAASILLADFPFGSSPWKELTGDGQEEYTVVPCLYETKKIQCINCRLCMDDVKLREKRIVIAFRASGARRSTVVRTLQVLNGEMH